MDGREGMTLSGSATYYLHRGISGSGSGSSSVTLTGLHAPPGFRPLSNPHSSLHSNAGGSSVGSTFPVEPSPNFPHGLNMGVSTGVPPGEPPKKKRGRPRKYGPGGTNMSLGLSPMSSTPSLGSITQTPRRGRGRPPGSGWKQRLAPLGDWMNSSAGLAFTPHVINIAVGEDIATKILSFSQQRARALCILSGSGAVSTVTLHQPTSSGSSVIYEILCLSGSYLVAEGGPHSRTGGLSISVCSPDGHVIGGGVGGRLIAASSVQVVMCSFVYDGLKIKNKTETSPKDKGQENSVLQLTEKLATPVSVAPAQSVSPNSARRLWPISRLDLRNPHTEIDLTRG
ncbi:AT-hook motif nuclear-localized protein 5 isoform X2 [Cornus florida]|uniref:AT-hook motif nuclear-localized protein 5 isoform X2 n=1 Tax=Cornus florida TaxID=4283 RepID=UPI00289A446A|nr:AT-hook motif nuclear-localized protein 5 isoform X2 [Cornus florida]